MKKVLVVLAVLVVIVVVVLLYIGANLDAIVAKAIESIGSKALGVDVSVGSVELQLKEGSGTIRNFEIANPPGYSRTPAVKLGELTLQLDSEAKSVKLLRAGAPEIRVESQGETSNIDALLAGLESEPAEAGESEVTDAAGEPMSLRIDRIDIEAARAVLISDKRDEPVDLQVEALVFENLEGTGEEIADQILSQLLSKVKQAVNEALKKAVAQAAEVKKEEAKEGLTARLKEKLKKD